MVDISQTIILVAFVLVMIGIALAFAITFLPNFTLSFCWASAQSQTQQLGEWYLSGPLLKEKIEKTITLGDCVEKMIFTNDINDIYCGEEPFNAVMGCPIGKKAYIVTCRRSGAEKFFTSTNNVICTGIDIPFSKRIVIKGPGTYCMTFEKTGDMYKISKRDGSC